MGQGWIIALTSGLLVGCGTANGGAAGAGGFDGGPGNGEGGRLGNGSNGDGSNGKLVSGDSGGKGDACKATVTCASAGAECGPINNGCGGIVQCGSCGSGKTCGGGGKASQCGTPCVAKTCTDLGFNCGPAGDGCGGSLSCGTCSGTETCGGGGTASQCGDTTSCTPTTCAALGYTCGVAGDGCGNSLDCGTCSGSQTCGGGGVSSVCGTPMCTPKTCAEVSTTCGAAADGCGGLLQCGSCNEPEVCGGLAPGQCGVPASCTGLCLQQQTCPAAGVTTTVSGTVFAPNGTDPLPNVLVYIPNAPVDAFTPGVACEKCSDGVSGSPLVEAVTDTTGAFTLTNAPVGTNIPLVIQTGRWRRQVTIPSIAACTNTALPACTNATATAGTCLTNLPQTKAQGDIPFMAFATGAVDSLECVMRKIGVADSEFTNPGGTGRINMYVGLTSATETTHHNVTTINYGALGGAQVDNNTPTADALLGSEATLSKYDMVLFPCEGSEIVTGQSIYNVQPPNALNNPKLVDTWANLQTAYQNNVVSYANAGGRVFTTHFSYIWLFNDAFKTTAQWDVNLCDSSNLHGDGTCANGPGINNPPADWGHPPDQTGFIQQNFPKGVELAEWLQNIGASTTLGQIPINTLRWDIDSSTAMTPGVSATESQLWMQIQDPNIGNVPMHYTFNTPLDQASQCGKVLFDDFHVENVTIDNGADDGVVYPTECSSGAMTPQEKLLEFMIFDLGSCVAPSQPSCTPTTCTALGYNCGPAGDGCTGVLQCGTCPTGQTCGGGGQPSVCGAPMCNAKSCMDQGFNCGPAGDGCGNALDCGTCPAGQTCGGGGMPGVCGSGMCKPETCASQGIQCGPAGDGCGNSLTCGLCPTGQTCGGGGTPGVCGTKCKPTTCTALGYSCGTAADGCGGQLSCGTCAAPNTCGGGGQANQCGGNIPK